MVRGQWGNLARMPGSHLYSFSKDILGFFLMTTESQELSLTSHLKDFLLLMTSSAQSFSKLLYHSHISCLWSLFSLGV